MSDDGETGDGDETGAGGPESGRGTIAAAADGEPRPLLSLVRDAGRGDFRYLGWGVVASLAAQFLSNLDMFVIGLAFDAMFNDRAYALPLVPPAWIPADPTPQLAFTVALLLGVKVFDMSLGISSQWSLFLFAQRTLHRVRVDAFDTVQRLDMDFFDTQQTGEVMSVLNNDVNSLERALEVGPMLGVTAIGMFASSLVYMALLDPYLALISLAVTPVIFGVNHWFGRRHEARNDEVREETGVLNALLETGVSGIQTVKAFGGEDRETERVTAQSATQRDVSWHAHMVGVTHQPTLRLVAGAAFVATLFVGTEWVLDGSFFGVTGTITAGELVPFAYYTQNLVLPVRFTAWVTGLYRAATSAARRIVGIQRMTPRRDDGDVVLADPLGRVAYEGVSFAYPGTDERVVDDVSLDVEPGETVGLVGETGAGKSTLLKLLLAYYDADEGAVRVDGHDVRELDRTSLRRSIGYVAQDPFLFTGTIRENIAYGCDDATDAEVEAAAKEAGAHEFIADLEEGYDSEVGERGVKLSGGQRQRVAIARTLLVDPPMMVLDEATSHVDNRTEVLIQRSLDRITAERTTFVVAHRLSTVRDADRIVHLEDGRVTEQGTHEELLARDGDYADLWRVQVGEVADS